MPRKKSSFRNLPRRELPPPDPDGVIRIPLTPEVEYEIWHSLQGHVRGCHAPTYRAASQAGIRVKYKDLDHDIYMGED